MSGRGPAAALRVGVVGAGFIGRVHAAAWLRLGVKRLLTWDPSREAPAGALPAGAEPEPAASLEHLVAEVDVVDICTPTDLHRQGVELAAAAGRHVICEKPIARTMGDAEAMLAACRAAGVSLFVGHVVRYFPEYAAARAAVAGGRIGRPAVLRLRRESFKPARPADHWLFDEARSGGVLLDLMIHDLDFARWIAGPVDTVMARRVRDASAREVDHAVALLRHASGAITHLTAGWSYPPPVFRTGFELAGDAGLIEYESVDQQPLVPYLMEGGGAAGGAGSAGTSRGGAGRDVGLPRSPLDEDPFMSELGDFAAAVVSGQPARVTAQDGVEALRIALAAVESSLIGRPVDPARLAP